MGFGVWGLGFGVWGLGFGVWGLGFWVWGILKGPGFRRGCSGLLFLRAFGVMRSFAGVEELCGFQSLPGLLFGVHGGRGCKGFGH